MKFISAETAVAGRTDQFHASAKRDYPLAEPLPMPNNIDQSESTRFSPQRARDISSTIIDSHNVSVGGGHQSIDITVDQTTQQQQLDAHVGPYDCTGAVHLSSSMQSNVPTPFGGMHKFTHLNMPGGQWGQGIRLMANDMHSSHYTNLRKSVRENWSTYDDAVIRPTQQTKSGICLHRRSSSTNAAASGGGAAAAAVVLFQSHDALTNACREFLHVRHRMYSTKSPSFPDEKQQPDVDTTGKSTPDAPTETAELTRGEKLKKAVKEYGSTVFVFHIGISLISLGSFYLLVSRYDGTFQFINIFFISCISLIIYLRPPNVIFSLQI